MSENLLQFIWQFRLYDSSRPLLTNEGLEAIVVHPGSLNKHAGPDFLEAKIKIGNTLWVGNIEIHLKSSDWKKHQHEQNENYSNLILHIVFEHDEEIETKNNSQFPTIELKNYIDKKLLHKYESLMNEQQFIPCEKYIPDVREITIHQQLDKMLTERLEEKTGHFKLLLDQNNNNWHEVFYIVLARSFGLHINQDAFEQLAKSIPLSMFAKHKNNIVQLEALLFGQAGFLFEYFDELYPIQLQKEYQYLQKLHSLKPIEKHHWKFLRLRPANFPTIRIAQFAQLLFQSTHLFSKITEAKTIKEIQQFFKIEVSDFWQSHYTFLETSTEKTKSMGNSFIHLIIINAIIPTLFIYGKMQGKEECCTKAIDFLKELKAEKNSIIEQWNVLKIKSENAADSQSLLQLKKYYCDKKRCLECSIGFAIMK
jgi:hypothetical protein